MNINRIDEIVRSAQDQGSIVAVSNMPIEEFVELCSCAKAHVMAEAMEAANIDPNPQPPPDWATLRAAFEEAARGLARIKRNDDRARAVAALAILLDVDSEVAEILSER